MPAKSTTSILDTVEGRRLQGSDAELWRQWGPYLSERQWGTVREDYSADGDAWSYFPHEHARSRAYRWGEDGLAGFSDKAQHWCLGLALWNEHDSILKERLFGLNNAEGNHGEDVKELYFYLDGVPSHAYMRMLYKYPQAAFPYADLVAENARRGLNDTEYEILDTGVFEDNRYFDVTVEYAKHTADDIFMLITVHNRFHQPARLRVLPQVWARNTWSWGGDAPRPSLRLEGDKVLARHGQLPERQITAWGAEPCQWLFCNNDSNFPKLDGLASPGPFKDGFNDYLVDGQASAVSFDGGTRVAAHFVLDLAGGESKRLFLRFAPAGSEPVSARHLFEQRRREADEFYAALQQGIESADARNVQRQALAGLLWSKQLYYFDVNQWLDGDPGQPAPPTEREHLRNTHWRHLSNCDIVSMPDTWEYPWYASWDLGFQAVAFALIDPGFAKQQLLLLVKDRFMHPNGQLPAYEWRFDDANPPVHAWACWRVYQQEKSLTGVGDLDFLERIFHKLLLNFSWWVNRKDAEGRNLFQGGFLGLDNIALFDRSAPLPDGFTLDQADGTAWVAAYALDLMRIALELAKRNGVYVDIAVKFFEHFLYIAGAINRVDESAEGLWDEQDQFFYDVLHRPDGDNEPLRLRSIVGLMPLFAVQVLEQHEHQNLLGLAQRLLGFLHHRPDLASLVSRWYEPGKGNRMLLALLRGERTKDLLKRMLDESEFLSDFGIRSLSKAFEQPFAMQVDGKQLCARYEPAESDSRLYGGNSNWRGPLWMPINYMLIESLREFHRYYDVNFSVEYPRGSGYLASLEEVADGLSQRLTRLFLLDEDGCRPSMSGYPQLQVEAEDRELVLFHEYFHGETGRGLGASHQTGWTALVALLLQPQR
ncbi:glucosidase [Pseudomonas protegens]|uniref:MGH1-like glycoside hydrolase domain-containing protein n=1 Tax=Pseudomonas protegens TaxID=380021 RepID=UPI001372BAEF|nr:glucosidase [Pseudomonas protegens]MBF0642732.1 glucosidase [Pseudomonas protegens]NAN55010.1 glucosidase [Pseudomonas protegens]NUE77050.1 glucosidase [Pseudomonas protegens]